MNKELIIIAGPTACGKTDISVRIAKEIETEIISADSRQIYKEMTIGTAVPSKFQLNLVPHHFIHHISINDYYNASMYEEEVLALLANLFKKYDQLVMTGGSGLYIDAVRFGIDDFPKTNPAIRTGLQKQFELEGIESLRKNLRFLDPETYKKIDLKNPKRIQKALEVCISTGKPYSSFLTSFKKQRDFKITMIVINREREELYNLINERVLLMMEKGLEKEAENLYQFRHLNALNTVGYRELFEYFENKISLDEAISRIQANTRNYARKQLTWFKKDDTANWVHPDQWEDIMKIINKNPQEIQ